MTNVEAVVDFVCLVMSVAVTQWLARRLLHVRSQITPTGHAIDVSQKAFISSWAIIATAYHASSIDSSPLMIQVATCGAITVSAWAWCIRSSLHLFMKGSHELTTESQAWSWASTMLHAQSTGPAFRGQLLIHAARAGVLSQKLACSSEAEQNAMLDAVAHALVLQQVRESVTTYQSRQFRLLLADLVVMPASFSGTLLLHDGLWRRNSQGESSIVCNFQLVAAQLSTAMATVHSVQSQLFWYEIDLQLSVMQQVHHLRKALDEFHIQRGSGGCIHRERVDDFSYRASTQVQLHDINGGLGMYEMPLNGAIAPHMAPSVSSDNLPRNAPGNNWLPRSSAARPRAGDSMTARAKRSNYVTPSRLHVFVNALQAAKMADLQRARAVVDLWDLLADSTVAMSAVEQTCIRIRSMASDANKQFILAITTIPNSATARSQYAEFVQSAADMNSEAQHMMQTAHQVGKVCNRTALGSIFQPLMYTKITAAMSPVHDLTADLDGEVASLLCSAMPQNGFAIREANSTLSGMLGMNASQIVNSELVSLFPEPLRSGMLYALSAAQDCFGDRFGGSVTEFDDQCSRGSSSANTLQVHLGQSQLWLLWNRAQEHIVPVVATLHLVHGNCIHERGASVEPLLRVIFAKSTDPSALFLVSLPPPQLLPSGAALSNEGVDSVVTPVVPASEVQIALSNASGANLLRPFHDHTMGGVGFENRGGAHGTACLPASKILFPHTATCGALDLHTEQRSITSCRLKHRTGDSIQASLSILPGLDLPSGRQQGVLVLAVDPNAGLVRDRDAIDVASHTSQRPSASSFTSDAGKIPGSGLEIEQKALLHEAVSLPSDLEDQIRSSNNSMYTIRDTADDDLTTDAIHSPSFAADEIREDPRGRSSLRSNDLQPKQPGTAQSSDSIAIELTSSASSSSSDTARLRHGKALLQRQLLGVHDNQFGSQALALWGHGKRPTGLRQYRSAAVSNAMRIIFVLAPFIVLGVILPTPLVFDPLLQNVGSLCQGLWMAGVRIQVTQHIESALRRMTTHSRLTIEPIGDNLLELEQLEAQFSQVSDKLEQMDRRTQDIVTSAADAMGIDISSQFAAPGNTSLRALQARFEDDLSSIRFWSDHQRWVPLTDNARSTAQIMTPFEVGQWIQANMRTVIQLRADEFQSTAPDPSVRSLLISGMLPARVWPAFNASAQARIRTLQFYKDTTSSRISFITLFLGCLLMVVILLGVCFDSWQIAKAVHEPLRLAAQMSDSTAESLKTKALERIDDLIGSSAGEGFWTGGRSGSSGPSGPGRSRGRQDSSDSGSSSDTNEYTTHTPVKPLAMGTSTVWRSFMARSNSATVGSRALDVDDSAAAATRGVTGLGQAKHCSGKQKHKRRKPLPVSVSWPFLLSNCFIVGLAPAISITFAAAVATGLVNSTLPSVFDNVARAVMLQEASYHQSMVRELAVKAALGVATTDSDQAVKVHGTMMLKRVSDVLNGTPNGPLGRAVSALPSESRVYHLLLENGCVSHLLWQHNCSTVFNGLAAEGGLVQPLLRMNSMIEEVMVLKRTANSTTGQPLFNNLHFTTLVRDIVAIDKRVTRDTVHEILQVLLSDVQTELDYYTALLYICGYSNMLFNACMALINLRYLHTLHKYLLSTRLILLFIPQSNVVRRSGRYDESYARMMQSHINESS